MTGSSHQVMAWLEKPNAEEVSVTLKALKTWFLREWFCTNHICIMQPGTCGWSTVISFSCGNLDEQEAPIPEKWCFRKIKKKTVLVQASLRQLQMEKPGLSK